MGYKPTQPDPESFIAQHNTLNIKLYAYLAACPLYATVRILAPGLIGNRRASFWLGWVIKDGRWAKGKDAALIPIGVLEWAAPLIKERYPDLETATGMNAEEIAEIEAEQALKRAEYDKARKGK